MRILASISTLIVLFCCCSGTSQLQKNDGWVSLFDGKSLNGWTANRNSGTFRVENGVIVVDGKQSHLFYSGDVMNHDFKDFEFSAEVMTVPGANSGIYFHTKYDESGWPGYGYEVQVNNSQSDWRRTGSLYGIKDIRETFVNDNEWYTQSILVKGKTIKISLNGKEVLEYVEPENVERSSDMRGRKLASGTFALQGHDPESKVYYRNIRVRVIK